MASSSLIAAFLILLIATCLSFISLSLPRWARSSVDNNTHLGLWQLCTDSNCTSIFRSQNSELKTAAILYVIGCVFVFVTCSLSFANAFCKPFKGLRKVNFFLLILCSLAAVSELVTVILFGIGVQHDHSALYAPRLDLCFCLALVSCAGILISLIIYVAERRRLVARSTYTLIS